MPRRPSHVHVRHLVSALRQTATTYQAMALERDDGCWELCVGAALANDAAEALEALLAERSIHVRAQHCASLDAADAPDGPGSPQGIGTTATSSAGKAESIFAEPDA